MPRTKGAPKKVTVRYRVPEEAYRAAEEGEARPIGLSVDQLEQSRFLARVAQLTARSADERELVTV